MNAPQTIGEVLAYWKHKLAEHQREGTNVEKTVKVQYVNPPKGAGKSSTIKTTDGELIGFFADKLSFRVGETYTILIEEREHNGRTYKNATRIMESAKPILSTPANDRWWMPFVSNTVAHALSCGQITDPLQVKTWASAAKQAAIELDAEVNIKAAQLDDDEPY